MRVGVFSSEGTSAVYSSCDIPENKNMNLFLNINQLDALNFIISLFQASTCFEHICSSSGGQKLYYTVSGIITLKQVSGLKLLK